MYMPEYYEEHDKDDELKSLLLEYEVPRNRVGFLMKELKIMLDKHTKMVYNTKVKKRKVF